MRLILFSKTRYGSKYFYPTGSYQHVMKRISALLTVSDMLRAMSSFPLNFPGAASKYNLCVVMGLKPEVRQYVQNFYLVLDNTSFSRLRLRFLNAWPALLLAFFKLSYF